MKKIYFLIFSLIFSSSVWASVNIEPLLNKVTLQMQAEQWVTTKTALVTVGINAAVSDQGIEKIQAAVMQKLNEFGNKAEWHIVSFNRQQDKSGLESIQISAQARMQQSDLTGLRDKAKAISKPGETYTIDDVQFTPSEDEQRQANITLRANLYQQAKAEIDTLNKMYPEQKYYLHQIDFVGSPPMEPMPMAQNMFSTKVAALRIPSAPLSVGNKVQLQAVVVLAAMTALPDNVAQKLAK